MSRRTRQDAEHGDHLEDQSSQKRRKTNNNGRSSEATPTAEVLIAKQASVDERAQPKSRKELRSEKKAAKKAASVSSSSSLSVIPQSTASKEDQRMEKKSLQKARRKEFIKEKELLLLKEERKEKKLRKEKRLRKEKNTPGGAKVAPVKGQQQKEDKLLKGNKSPQKLETDMGVFHKVFNGSTDDATGTTTLRLGVQYKDIVVGTGAVVQDKTLVTVKYKLTAGKFGNVLDSSKKFTFRLSKGEVIQGWDIGMIGMRQGGRRSLIVPPKAGYGSQDIGAGSGAVLHFDITLLSC
jgi:FKBP-type peptidyl-prolyl cis-trans isomerase